MAARAYAGRPNFIDGGIQLRKRKNVKSQKRQSQRKFNLMDLHYGEIARFSHCLRTSEFDRIRCKCYLNSTLQILIVFFRSIGADKVSTMRTHTEFEYLNF